MTPIRRASATIARFDPRRGRVVRLPDHLLVGTVLVDDATFEVRGGEVLAIAGVQGNGQTELTEAIIGLQDHVRGSIR